MPQTPHRHTQTSIHEDTFCQPGRGHLHVCLSVCVYVVLQNSLQLALPCLTSPGPSTSRWCPGAHPARHSRQSGRRCRLGSACNRKHTHTNMPTSAQKMAAHQHTMSGLDSIQARTWLVGSKRKRALYKSACFNQHHFKPSHQYEVNHLCDSTVNCCQLEAAYGRSKCRGWLPGGGCDSCSTSTSLDLHMHRINMKCLIAIWGKPHTDRLEHGQFERRVEVESPQDAVGTSPCFCRIFCLLRGHSHKQMMQHYFYTPSPQTPCYSAFHQPSPQTTNHDPTATRPPN